MERDILAFSTKQCLREPYAGILAQQLNALVVRATFVRSFRNVAVCGISVFQHCTAGKFYSFELVQRLNFVDYCMDYLATAIETLPAKYFHRISPCNNRSSLECF